MKKIYISPSDQWSNLTAINGVSEAKQCKMIADECEEIFLRHGYIVKVGDNSKEKSYVNRVKESNDFKADIHICIHTNAGGGSGTLVLCHPSRVNNEYVNSVYERVASLTPSKDKGIYPRIDLYEINKTNALCVYIEVDFHDNQTSENWIYSNIENIALAICKGIFDIDEKEDLPIYRVQVGAFADKINAERLLERLKSDGYRDAFITKRG